MFLTTCAVCAKALDDEVEAPRRCEPCGTRYCGEECERAGRDHDCGAIVRAGGAEAAYEKVLTAARRLWGAGHPYPKKFENHLEKARAALAAPKSARFERALKRARKE